ncbi:hypothetical protein CPB83DRAFT_892823 [Crepidotus variabilis]|uniref:Fruit-body specific protein a n=1 Tax=Crepidotus variabilis TaxID=179855 RepID=A0A9P6EJR1_9AGAR|nr:hypothetical protein CPB83DRAFT_892823 [Crepidotus variabilis]
MPRLLLALLHTLLLVTAYAFNTSNVPDNLPDIPSNRVDLTRTLTDATTIANTVAQVRQKAGASGNPNHPVPETVVTARDGKLTSKGQLTSNATSLAGLFERSKRSPSDYILVFGGSPVNSEARDASIEGTAYLTFTLVSNATYNIGDCLAFCDSVRECVFANIYYEFNNDALDHRESSNLKCAVYADTHTAAEKTNYGGQQSEPLPAGLTYIQQSSGFSKRTLVDPTDPDGYSLVFGPTSGANNAPGYMGFSFLDRYDVAACAKECNQRGADGQGGACKYFNIWRAVVNGNPTTYTCSMYYLVADQSTATNTGQGDLKVTYSRGYKRLSYAEDGGFESLQKLCFGFCWTQLDSSWAGINSFGGFDEAAIFYYTPYAHSGGVIGMLGSLGNYDNLPGTLTPVKPLKTVAGKKYLIEFFYASTYSGSNKGANAYVDVSWNGQVVNTVKGYSTWKPASVEVVGKGGDTIAFHGGAGSAIVFLDDVGVFQL